MLGQATDVMVGLDQMRLACLGAGRFDDIRINRTLRQPASILEFLRFFFEDFNKQITDNLALTFRINLVFQRLQEPLFRIHPDNAYPHVLGKRGHNLVAFMVAQQAGIHENTGQLVANGFVQ